VARNYVGVSRQTEAWKRLSRSPGLQAAGGDGGDDDGPIQMCPSCNGAGKLKHAQTGRYTKIDCPTCEGAGTVPADDEDQDQAAAHAGRHIRFERGQVRTVAAARGRWPALPVAALDGEPPIGAQLDHFPWARSWRSYLTVIKDRADFQGARAAIRKVMDGARPLNAALSERVPAEGGFLVPERLRSQVLNYMMGSIIRPRCTVLTLDSERVPVPLLDNPSQASGAQALGGLTFSFTEEGAAIPASVPNFGRIVLEAWPDKALMQNVPNELISDSAAFTDYFLPQVIAKGLSWHIDDYALYQGTGTGQPQALVNAPGAVAVTRNPPSGFSVGHVDVVTMLKNLHPASKCCATWLASEDVFSQLLELYEIVGSAPTGQDIPPPKTMLYNSDSGRWELLGLEIIPNDHQPAAGTVGDLMLADLDLLLLGERDSMVIEVAPHAGFGSDTSHIRVRHRWDSRYWLQSSVTLTNGKVVSPLVVLH
jgi:HK97 family phage major capsid protein